MPMISLYDGLRILPHVFHVADLTLRLGWKPQDSLRQLFVWKVSGQVKELGGESGVFANLKADQYPDWELGLRVVMPTGLIIGIEVLRRAGWTTQIPYRPTVAVSSMQRVYQVKHFEIVALPLEWFDLMRRGVRGGEEVALPHLAPAWALADLIKREGWCTLQPRRYLLGHGNRAGSNRLGCSVHSPWSWRSGDEPRRGCWWFSRDHT